MRSLLAVSALLPAVMAQNYYGCYTEGTSSRALTGSFLADFENMTVPLCQSYCTGLSFSLWGLEYAGECYCGNSLTVGSISTFSSQCNVACAGNATQICGGGGGHLSLYGTSAEAPVETPAPHPDVTATQYLGCYTEGNGTRALTGSFVFDETEMTPEACGNFCINRGFTIFGLEYMAECYCGSALDVTSVPAPEADCSMPCKGNASLMCGGSDRLSVYQWYNAGAEPSPTSAPSTEPTATAIA